MCCSRCSRILLNKVFYPREVAIVNDKFKLCYEIDCEFSDDFILNNQQKLSFQKHQIHGIPVKKFLSERTAKVFKNSEFGILLNELYMRLCFEDKKYFGVKNQQLSKFFDVLGIPYVNLENLPIGGEFCPTFSTYSEYSGRNFNFCSIHDNLCKSLSNKHLRCALKKSSYIWEWLKNKNISDVITNEIKVNIELSFSNIVENTET